MVSSEFFENFAHADELINKTNQMSGFSFGKASSSVRNGTHMTYADGAKVQGELRNIKEAVFRYFGRVTKRVCTPTEENRKVE